MSRLTGEGSGGREMARRALGYGGVMAVRDEGRGTEMAAPGNRQMAPDRRRWKANRQTDRGKRRESRQVRGAMKMHVQS